MHVLLSFIYTTLCTISELLRLNNNTVSRYRTVITMRSSPLKPLVFVPIPRRRQRATATGCEFLRLCPFVVKTMNEQVKNQFDWRRLRVASVSPCVTMVYLDFMEDTVVVICFELVEDSKPSKAFALEMSTRSEAFCSGE